MLLNLKVKTLDAQTHEFSIDDETSIRDFKDKVAEKTSIAAEQQRLIYCGRVLVDEKQLKDYAPLDGKVLHVAERPPPSQRRPSTPRATNNATDRERRPQAMRNSPLFRALDGIVVGSMSLPTNGQGPSNPFTSSSSFCMNRITVARHMLDCANNIANYLEDPERGLNNTSMDILSRGRWTMESTVVEVGITAAELPQAQNIVEMVQDAVTAALNRNGNTNVTVLQLPTVFGSNETENAEAAIAEALEDGTSNSSDISDGVTAALIEEVVEDLEEDNATNASSSAAQAGSVASVDSIGIPTVANSINNNNPTVTNVTADATNNATSTGTNTDTNSARRQTRTTVLAEVIRHMRNVQARLNPFIDQFYNLLLDDPSFEENDVSSRLTAQRLYDRISEAFHYLSHAQHAISDLMLDISQPAPRFLTCRPILVEQSGYVSTNNYLNAATAFAEAAQARHQQMTARQQPVPQTAAPAPTTTPSSANTVITSTANTNPTIPTAVVFPSSNNAVEDPTDEPVIIDREPADAIDLDDDMAQHQHEMERIIQAVVNSAPHNTEFHVQIGVPMEVTVETSAAPRTRVLVGGNTAVSQAQRIMTATPAVNANAGNTNTTNANEALASMPRASQIAALVAAAAANQARVNTVTLPTTSTQTRSTSRPQLQIGNMPTSGWNGRYIPANMMSAFDRFLPCNSHHIAVESELGGANAGNSAGATPAGGGRNAARNQFFETRGQQLANNSGPFESIIRVPTILANANNATVAPDSIVITNPTTMRDLRTQLLNFIVGYLFEGRPINAETIPTAVNRAVSRFNEMLIYLPQYEKPEYNSRDSILNILRITLPLFIDTVRVINPRETIQEFEQRLRQLIQQFTKRLYSVLHVCIGPVNAEIYWRQLIPLVLSPASSIFQEETMRFIRINFTTEIPSTTDTSDAQQFIVHRVKTQTAEETTAVSQDVDMLDAASTSPPLKDIIDLPEEAAVLPVPVEIILPDVVTGSEPWHRHFPNHWLPIISRDLQTQQEESATEPAPFSDAYISGMSAKRRKLIQSNKPSTNVDALISDSVRKAMHTVGVTNSTASNQSQTPEEITMIISNDSAVQSSYTEAVRTHVSERIKNDPDYNASKYPQMAKFVNKK